MRDTVLLLLSPCGCSPSYAGAFILDAWREDISRIISSSCSVTTQGCAGLCMYVCTHTQHNTSPFTIYISPTLSQSTIHRLSSSSLSSPLTLTSSSSSHHKSDEALNIQHMLAFPKGISLNNLSMLIQSLMFLIYSSEYKERFTPIAPASI